MRRKQNFQTIAWFWDIYKRDLLDLDPPYQRRSVWNQAYKDYFIDTILLQYPAPAIFLYEEISAEGVAAYHVVDGKQRLTTIFEFAGNRFPVSDDAQRTELRGLYFQQLPDDVKTEFWSYQFSVEYLPTTEEGTVNSVFNRINRNTARLTAQELRHARFYGEFITAAEDLATWMAEELPSRFPVITTRARSQMKDVEIVAELLLLLETGARGYSTLQLDEAFSARDEEWEEKAKVTRTFRAVIEAIKSILGTEAGKSLAHSRLRNQADFYSLVGSIDGLLREGQAVSPEDWAARLVEFVRRVEDEEGRPGDKDADDYYEAARSASNDTGPRRTRISIMERVLAPVPEDGTGIATDER